MVCALPDEAAIDELVKYLDLVGITYVVFREPDLGDTRTSVATAPLTASQRRALRHYQLWGSQ